MRTRKSHFLMIAALFLFANCSNEFVVSINEQAIYDPEGRLRIDEVADADLQGCINLALQQQNLSSPDELTVLSCANSEISDLRLSDINAGAELTETERENLLAAIAEKDVDGWITHNGFEITLLDGSIYAYFNGYSLGPGGFDFKFFSFFKTYEELLRHITSLPMSYVE